MSTLLWGLSVLNSVTAVQLLATHFSGQIYTLDLALKDDLSSGTLKVTSKNTGAGVTPAWLHLDQATRTLYAIDESWQGSGVLTQWSVDKQGGKIKLQATAKTPGNSVHADLYGGKDGKGFLITSEYSPSTITTYKLPITANTKPIQTLEFTQAKPGPRPDRQDKPHPHAAFTDPTGDFIVVPDLGADLTRIFKVNKNTGVLTAGPAIASLPGDGPRHGLFKQVGYGLKYYSLNEVSSSIGVYDVRYPTNSQEFLKLTLVQTISTYGPNVPLGNVTVKAAEIRIIGDDLYASNRNDSSFGFEQDSIATYKIQSGGNLKFQKLANSYSYYPRTFAFNKEGTLAAIGGQTTANIAIVARNPRSGELGKLVANIVLPPRGTYGGEDGVSSIIWDES
ncbi:Lactonase, 7-bladed beta-propeller-domain-containing protein [Dendryphion nanum]|uniref:Lactonase, 7-bladed beta-propeller-domain-containing protein n=1 Tax=Dendryphion nanum TaxID=256645 RepID=A0A9P9DAX3_9PLEO|nr:Lactonase, 7-bladed beta-propeller-domain-containing protein [Dendryphion nanum]